MSNDEKFTLEERLDASIKELQRVRKQLSTLAEVAGSSHTSPDDIGAIVQSLSAHIWTALKYIRAARGQTGKD